MSATRQAFSSSDTDMLLPFLQSGSFLWKQYLLHKTMFPQKCHSRSVASESLDSRPCPKFLHNNLGLLHNQVLAITKCCEMGPMVYILISLKMLKVKPRPSLSFCVWWKRLDQTLQVMWHLLPTQFTPELLCFIYGQFWCGLWVVTHGWVTVLKGCTHSAGDE